jgi:CRISPR-associated protein Cas6
MPLVELAFPIQGRTLPENNGYLLYAALSRALDGHLPDGVAVSSVGGTPIGGWRIGLDRASWLRLRLPSERIGELLGLAGRFLDVGGHEVALGIPRITAVTSAASLISRMVTIKKFTDPGPFLEAARRQMDGLGIVGTPSIPLLTSGPHEGKPKRRVLRIKGKAIVGFAMIVEGLSAADSERLLTSGLGGRRRMGCGIFVPTGRGDGPRSLRKES